MLVYLICYPFFFNAAQACRTKVLKKLRQEFKTIEDAETSYGITYFDDVSSQMVSHNTVLPGEILQYVTVNFVRLSKEQRMQLLTCLLHMLIEMDCSKELRYFVPRDLLPLLLSGMKHLHEKEKDNVIYDLCKCLGEMRADGSGARINVDVMPFGLLAFNCKFFASDDASNLRASEDYKKWMESMYSYFGNSWASLFLGPMWSYEGDPGRSENGSADDILTEAIVSAFGGLTIPDINDESVCPTSIPVIASSPVLANPSASCSPHPVSVSTVSPASNPGHVNASVVSTPSTTYCRESTGRNEEQSGQTPHAFTLWSGLSPTERDELAESEVHHRDIAAMHQVTPPIQTMQII